MNHWNESHLFPVLDSTTPITTERRLFAAMALQGLLAGDLMTSATQARASADEIPLTTARAARAFADALIAQLDATGVSK